MYSLSVSTDNPSCEGKKQNKNTTGNYLSV